ncbi:MAG TPA: CPBP family glutamic-type intramembrane protease [Vitreimonas sp.]|nr:CPBP family glutamic-type intramembrane protease [Vitreimonas sp.]
MMTTELYTFLFEAFTIVSVSTLLAIKFKFLPLKFSYTCLIFLVILSAALTWYSQPTWRELGMMMPSLTEIGIYMLMTVICGLVILYLNKHFYHGKPANIFIGGQALIVFYAIISAPAQEFLFRSFVYYSLAESQALSFISMVGVSTALFWIAHLVFDDLNLMQGTFFMGLIWSVIYFFIPNLPLVSLSHAVIGVLAFQQGIITRRSILGDVI